MDKVFPTFDPSRHTLSDDTLLMFAEDVMLTPKRTLEIIRLADELAATVEVFTMSTEGPHRDVGLLFQDMIDAAGAYLAARKA